MLLCALTPLLAACGEDDDEPGADRRAPKAPATEKEEACRDVEQREPRPDGGAKQPTAKLDPAKTYRVVLETSCGEITIRLNHEVSPRTAASFAKLARTGFFDNTTFHRIVPGFVIQGGDPTGRGSGGPGYSTRDVPPPDTVYEKGTVAMAKTAAEPPGTAGSQFYIVTATDAGLPPEYAVLGEVVKGQQVVEAIGELGDPASGDAGIPLKPVVIENTALIER